MKWLHAEGNHPNLVCQKYILTPCLQASEMPLQLHSHFLLSACAFHYTSYRGKEHMHPAHSDFCVEVRNVSRDSRSLTVSAWWWGPHGSVPWWANSISPVIHPAACQSWLKETQWWIVIDTVWTEERPSGSELLSWHLSRTPPPISLPSPLCKATVTQEKTQSGFRCQN